MGKLWIICIETEEALSDERGDEEIEKLFTAREVADILRVSEDQVYELVKQGQLAVVKVGAREKRFTRKAVADFIDKGGASLSKDDEVANIRKVG